MCKFCIPIFFKDLNCPEKSTTCVPKCGDDVKSFQNVSSQLLCAGRDYWITFVKYMTTLNFYFQLNAMKTTIVHSGPFKNTWTLQKNAVS